MSPERIANLALRIGVAFALLYPPLSAVFGDPYTWVGYFPAFVRGYAPDPVLLHAFGAAEVVLGLWILSGYKIFIPSLLATALLLGIVALNLPQFDVLFRDVAIACLTLSLVLINKPHKYTV